MGKTARGPATLRTRAPWRALEGFGRAMSSSARVATPTSVEDLRRLLAQARAEGLPVVFRGAGRSYGDASLAAGGLSIDTTGMNRMLAWDPQRGIAECEPGVTIEGLWRRALPDGYWPAVVPGTMAPTLAGCLAMNVHGKNNFKAGPIGEHVLDFDLMTADGTIHRCSRDENADIFHAAIGGLGLLGAFTRIRLQLKKVDAGHLLVEPLVGRNLDELFDQFEARIPQADYLVGWVDCAVGGARRGRGIIHQANYLDGFEGAADELRTERQTLPSKILFVPKSILWRFMRPFMTNPGVRLVNAVKYWSSRWKDSWDRMWTGRTSYLQTHVGFAFLLDYVPNWRLGYGRRGFIQYQIFAPATRARSLFADVLQLGLDRGMPSYLGVLKRHRPDAFLMTHALDGWSLALDFAVRDRAKLWRYTEELSQLVLDAGGKFYFAKDAVLRPADVERAYGREALDRFFALKRRLDPEGLFGGDLARRVFPDLKLLGAASVAQETPRAIIPGAAGPRDATMELRPEDLGFEPTLAPALRKPTPPPPLPGTRLAPPLPKV